MTRQKATDGGLALVLILIIIAWIDTHNLFVGAAAVGILLCMVTPRVFTPFARIWYSLSYAMGTVMSKVLLTLVYFLVVLPVGILRRLSGADPMLLKRWKKKDGSVFVDRAHRFTAEDVERPY
ncbi:MAG: SxtJ family membrane protein [Thermodesulfobacteriota bacterium]|nr:SxtJ family membrane protein [Thermodesulfobacteriota bacterium]